MKNKNNSILKTLKEFVPKHFDFFKDYGFKLIKNKIWGTYFYDATYQKDNLYIRIDANIHPRDYPMYLNIILGEGSSDWPDTDWNSTSLWRIAKQIDKNIKIGEYQLEDDKQFLIDKIQEAKEDFIKYNGGFLEGKLDCFFEARSIMNKDREPYKIHKPNTDGTYSTFNDEASSKLKKKYSKIRNF